MAQPRDYTRQYNFKDFQATSPSSPLPGTEVDAELNSVKLTLDDLNANIAKVQRDDGKLGNTSVHKDAFDQGALAIINSTFTPRGNWATGIVYAVSDAVNFNGATYSATVAHTSSAAFSTDNAASRWILIANAGITGSSQAVDKFEGTGSATAFTLSYTYESETSFFVFVNGELLNPVDDYTLSGTTLTLYTAPGLPSVAGNENVIVWGSSVSAQTAKDAAEASASNASGFANEAESWASKVNGIVESTDYSSKAWSIGGTGVDAGSGSSKDWATKTGGTVGNTSEYSSKYWATQGNVPIVATNIADVNTVGTNISSVNTVAGIDANVTTVSGIASDVTAVSANNANVTTVAGISANVTTAAGDSADIQTVASRSVEIGRLGTADAVSDMNTLGTAAIVTDLDTLADISTDISTVSGISGNVTTAAGISANITTVSGISGNVTTVAGINSAVSTVSGIASDVTAVSANNANVTTVAGNNANVSTVAGVSTDVTTVSGISGNVTIVAGISGNVTTVSGIASDVSTVSTNNANVTTTAGSITSVNTVAASISNVNTAASNIGDVNTVAGEIGVSGVVTIVAAAITDVSTVSGDIAAVITAANDLNEAVSEIDTVSNSIANVDAVGTNISNVNTVAGNNANVSTVAGNTTNINTVAGNNTNVTTVAGISGNVSTVAGMASDVTAVAADAADIGTVSTNINNVNAVVSNATNINAVAGNATNINAVAADASDIGTVATNISTVNAVAGNETNINSVNANATNINTVAADATDIGTVSGSIANVNVVGGAITNVNTVATNIDSVNDFADKYRVGATDPSTNNDEGDLFYNTASDTLKVYTGSAWEQGVTAGSGFMPLSGGQFSGNITFAASETVDGRDVSADGTKLDGIEASATADQTAAEIRALVEGASDSNVFTDADHTKLNAIEAGANVTDTANVVASLTAGSNITISAGGTIAGAAQYTHPTHAGDDINIDTGALSGATVISDLDFNVTTDTLGHVTDANATIATRNITLANLGYTGATNANNYSFPYTVSDGEGINTVVRRTSAGYIHGSYFNGTGTFATSGASSGMGNFTGNNGNDTYGRSYNAAAARTLLNVANGANNITNNNQISNGAGYATTSAMNTAIGNISSSPTITLTDSGSGITAGKTVIVTSDGKAEQVGQSPIATSLSQSTTVLASGLTRSQGNVAYGNGYVVAVFADTNYDLCTVSGLVNANGTISWTSHRVQYATTCWDPRVCYLEDQDRWVIGFRNSAVSNRFYVIACTMDASSGRLNAYYGLTANTSNTVPTDIEVTANGHTAIFCMRQNNRLKTQCVRIDSSTFAISMGAFQEWTSAISYSSTIRYNKTLDRVVLFYKNNNNPRLRVLVPPPSFSDTTMVSAANEVVASNVTVNHAGNLTFDIDTTGKFVGYFKDSTGKTTVMLADVTATSISVRSLYNYSTTQYHQQYGSIVYDPNIDKFLWVYRDYTGSTNRPVKGVTITAPASGNLASGSFTEVASTATNVNNFSYGKGAYAPEMYGMVYTPYNNSLPSAGGNQIEAMVYRSASAVTNLTTENFIGFAAGSYSANATATINLVGTAQGSQSGLTAGKKHYVQNDGSLSTTAGTPSVYAGIATSASNIIVKG